MSRLIIFGYLCLFVGVGLLAYNISIFSEYHYLPYLSVNFHFYGYGFPVMIVTCILIIFIGLKIIKAKSARRAKKLH